MTKDQKLTNPLISSFHENLAVSLQETQEDRSVNDEESPEILDAVKRPHKRSIVQLPPGKHILFS